MQVGFVDLASVLEEELNLQRELIQLSRAKRAALIAGSLPDLEANIRSQEGCLKDLRQLENRRMEILGGLAWQLNRDPSEITLETLSRLSPVPWGERFAGLRKALEEAIEELTYINEGNTSLIEHSLAYVDFSLRAILGPATGGIYGEGGRHAGRDHGSEARLVNRRA